MIKTKPTVTTLTAALAAVAFSLSAQASDWTGANAGWSSNASPGWNGTGVPNAAGAVANHGVSTTTVTTQDIVAGVTVGTVSLTNNSNNSWSFTLTNPITLNQDGAGAGAATISNTDTNAGTTNFISFGSAGAGSLVLADDLLISNTGASTNATGAIQIAGVVSGAGNLTLSNPGGGNSTSTGVIRFVSATNTFVGNVLVQSGATTFNVGAAFGGVATNVVTLGQAGQGSATLVSTAGITMPNNIVVAAGSGGTQTIGTTSTSNPGFSGTVTLNDNLTITSASTNATGLVFSGAISGANGITKVGTGILRFSNTSNSYSGGTTISAGTMIASANNVFGTGGVSLATSTVLTLNATVTNAISDSATLTLAGTGSTAGKLNLLGTAGTSQETVAGLVLNGVAQPDGTYGNTGSGATTILTDYFTGTGILTVTSVPEPSTWATMALGLAGICGLRRMRSRRA